MCNKNSKIKKFFSIHLKHDISIYLLASFDPCDILTITICEDVDINSFFFGFHFGLNFYTKMSVYFLNQPIEL